MFRRLIVFVVQFVVVLACIAGGCAAYIIHDKGMAYAHTVYFRQDMDVALEGSLAATGVIFFVLICYRLTRQALQSGNDPDNTFWS